MTRLLLVMTFAAVSLIPQLLEAQLFRRGFRARGARQPVQQPRAPIFQNLRANNGGNQPLGMQPQPNEANRNSQRLGRSLDALHSVLESTVDGRPIARATSVLQGQGNNQVVANRQPMTNVPASQPRQVASPTTMKKTYSILVRPDESGNREANDSEPAEGATPGIDSTQTKLDITTPPLEPVEVIQDNSILQIVETPRKNGGI